MDRSVLISKVLSELQKLPDYKLEQAADFVSYLMFRLEDGQLQKGIQHLASNSPTWKWLEEEEEIYTVKDLKEKYE